MDPPAITRDVVLSQLERVLSSAAFRGADRSSTMLRFLVERALDGQSDRLKEYTVGVEALGKGVAFDPRADPIVRAEASRLRSRLERYYLADGRADPLVIELPKGAYVPQFNSRAIDNADAHVAASPTRRSSRARAITWILLGALATVGAFAIGVWVARPEPKSSGQPLVRLDVQLQTGGILGSEVGTDVVIAPDGSRVVFVSTDSAGVARLRTRRLDGSPPIDLPGTQGARGPFFSPDGRWIGFWAAGQIRKTSVDGGSPVVLSEATDLLGASWGDDGTIVAALNSTDKLWRLSSAGGTPTSLLALADGSAPHWPQLLPGGTHVLYTAVTGFGADRANIEVARLRDGKRTVVIKGGTYGRFVAPGYLTYVNQGTLYAVPFDLDGLEARGPATPILDDVAYSATFGYAQMDFSRSGLAVYRRSPGSGHLIAAWLDSSGRATPLIDAPGRYLWPALSPDGRRLSLSAVESGVPSVSIFENLNDGSPRVVARLAGYMATVWSPDGRFLVAGGNAGLSRIGADGGAPRTIVDDKTVRAPWSFTPDGRRIAVHAMSPTTAFDLWTIAVGDTGAASHDGPPEVILQTPFFEVYPSISPDGRWLAYSSNESGAWEVYVRAFPDNGTKVLVSRGGGRVPRWSRNGRELFYATDDQRLMVTTHTTHRGRFVSAVPRLWTSVRLADTGVLPNFDLAPDGRRIVALMPAATAGEAQQENHITLMINFADELRRRTTRP